MANKNKDKIYSLSGIDSFILALEKHHKAYKSSSNICSYVVDLDGILSLARLEKELNDNEIIHWISKFYVSEFVTKKRWERDEDSNISIGEVGDFNEVAIDKSVAPLFRFGVQKLDENKSRFIMSWHHLLMDGFGAVLLFKSLGKTIENVDVYADVTTQTKKSFIKAIKAKLFLNSTSKGHRSVGFDGNIDQGNPKLEIINFSEDAVSQIKENALTCGAVFGLSTFYLSAVSIALKNTLIRRGKKDVNFWVPVPHDSRKKGANSPILGNYLTFIFYRIFQNNLVDLKTAVKTLNEQTVHQIKNDIPNSYTSLMHYLKNIPSNLYYYWIKGPNGRSLSSFLFTIAAEHPESLNELFGLKIKSAISLPPNTYPPGITFSINTFGKQQQLAIQYYDNVFSSEEIQVLKDEIKALLIDKK